MEKKVYDSLIKLAKKEIKEWQQLVKQGVSEVKKWNQFLELLKDKRVEK